MRKVLKPLMDEVNVLCEKNNWARKPARSLVWNWVTKGICKQEEAIKRLTRYKSLNPTAVTKEKLILKYGEEDGLKRWDHYIERQRITNTKEYKMQVHGMTSEEVDAYNKSRAVTLENCIKRHGKEKGTEIFEKYRKRQAYAGVKLEYFIEKYGEERGRKEYEQINERKAHNYENYKQRYGSSAIQKLEEYYSKRGGNFISKTSTKFLDFVDSLLTDDEIQHSYREYTVYSHKHNRVFMYDYVNTKLKFCIEYNGNYWHGNPKMYSHDEVMTHGRVDELWEKDYTKMRVLFDNRDILSYTIVWESEELSKEQLEEFIDERRKDIKLCN
nr:MAG TPA: DNA mismatch endonuclease [Caudoviricetes sp.]